LYRKKKKKKKQKKRGGGGGKGGKPGDQEEEGDKNPALLEHLSSGGSGKGEGLKRRSEENDNKRLATGNEAPVEEPGRQGEQNLKYLLERKTKK